MIAPSPVRWLAIILVAGVTETATAQPGIDLVDPWKGPPSSETSSAAFGPADDLVDPWPEESSPTSTEPTSVEVLVDPWDAEMDPSRPAPNPWGDGATEESQELPDGYAAFPILE